MNKIVWFVSLLLLITCCKSEENAVLSSDNYFALGDTLSISAKDCERCIVVDNKVIASINIVDIALYEKLIWTWYPENSNIVSIDKRWFSNGPDELKPVYSLNYILITSPSGGVALIRIADKKVVWYAHAGKNPHSCEILPDGNIVAASSTDNRLVIFHVDTTESPNSGYRKIVKVPFAHNAVWDKKRKLLWTAGKNKLYSFKYNFNCTKPDLIPQDTISLPGNNAHDLFPVYGKDALWLTNPTGIYQIDLSTMNISRIIARYQKNIKSISSGPPGWPTIMQSPTYKWLSDELIDLKGNVIFKHLGWKIYKARWFLPNLFSYPANDKMKVCG